MYEVNAGDPGDIMVRIDAAPDALVDEAHGKDNGAVSGALNGALNGALKLSATQQKVYGEIARKQGITAEQIVSSLGFGKSTVDRCILYLKSINLVERRGSRKTGGYFLK